MTETRQRTVTTARAADITDTAYADRLQGIRRVWTLEIITGPGDHWHAIGGWGPWTEHTKAREALMDAGAQWEAARLLETATGVPVGYLPRAGEWRRLGPDCK